MFITWYIILHMISILRVRNHVVKETVNIVYLPLASFMSK